MIKIIDNSFNFLGEIDDYESLIYTRSYSGLGSFELRINANKNSTDKLQNENIIFLTDKKAGVILHREIDTANQETLIIKGLTLKAYIGRRITIPPVGLAYDYKNAFAENIIKDYVNSNCITPADNQRILSNLIVLATQNRGSQIIYQTRLKNLAEEIEAIANISGLGWDVYLDLVAKTFVFEVYEGRDLTAGQSLLPPAIFSIDYDNISSQKLVDSKINYRNIGYVGGQGEGADRTIEVVGDAATDIGRFETFIDARDIEDGADLGERGLQKLKEFAEVLTFDNAILTRSNLIYEQDFDLGDIVTAVNKKWNVTLNSRITEITEVYEPDGFKVSAVFGNDIPTLIQKIKKELAGPLTEKNTSAGVTSYNDLTDKPTIPDQLADLAGDAANRTVTDVQIAAITHSNRAALDLVAGANTGDQNAAAVSIADAGGIITGTNVETALQEIKTAVNLNTAKVTNASHTGAVTGGTALTITDAAVTNAKLAHIATAIIKGRVAAGTGDVEDLSAANVRTIINVADGANNYTHPATHSADIITDGTTNKAYTATEKTKLSGIAAGAEVNVNADWNAVSGDAQILNKPASMPASDVSAWAKEATKPTYTASEVGADTLVNNHTASDFHNYSLFRQALINGNFDIWQRGISFAAGAYAADRWYIYLPQASTISRQDGIGVNGSLYCFRFQRNSGVTGTGETNLEQRLKSIDSKKFISKKLTLSFWARAGANFSGTVTSRVYSGTSADDSSFAESAVEVYQINTLTANWQKFSHTTTNVLANTKTQLKVGFRSTPVGTAGANDYYEITQVQLCAGDTALPFSPKSFDEELRDCRYYFRKSFPYSVAPAVNAGTAGSILNLTGSTNSWYVFPRIIHDAMNKIPTVVFYNPSATTANTARNESDGTDAPMQAAYKGDSGFNAQVVNTSIAENKSVVYHYTEDAEF